MTLTREEAERISETDDVAAALRYLVDSHSTNAAVDLVQAVMNAVKNDANKKVGPVAWQCELSGETRWVEYKSLANQFKVKGWKITPLYPHSSPSSELLQAAEEVLELFLRVWISDDGINLSPEEKGKLNALRIELDKFK